MQYLISCLEVLASCGLVSSSSHTVYKVRHLSQYSSNGVVFIFSKSSEDDSYSFDFCFDGSNLDAFVIFEGVFTILTKIEAGFQ